MQLPVILAGPILRRLDENGVNIWIATSRPFQVDAELYSLTDGITPLRSRCQTRTIRTGKNLYIHLICLSPVHASFPTDVLLGYNVQFKNATETLDLGSFGYLDQNDSRSIVYGDCAYPSFFINRQADSHVLYGSCRKPHGKRDDAFVAGDLELQSTCRDMTKRPNSLFLLGDQIYADDVADPLFPLVTSLAKELMGRDENLAKLDKRLADAPFVHSLNQVNGRQFILDHFCKFTSTHSNNHLMKFGEYAAMYLLSWGPELWETIQEQGGFPTFEEEVENNRIYFVFPQTERFVKEHRKEYALYRKRFEEHSENLRQTVSSLRHIRRLLANVPTYMMFDDHDVTDDWNLSMDWRENVLHSPLGKHIVANGLGAYFLFQGWANAPDSYDAAFIDTMNTYFHQFTIGSAAYANWVSLLWNHGSWHFVAPTEPKTIFLDTRTQRMFDATPEPSKLGLIIQENVRSPQLISHEGWKRVSRSLLESGWRKGERLFIASPAPLYGLGLIESFLHSYVYPLRTIGIPVHQAIDYEAWKYNGKGFSEFLEWVFKWGPSACVILSGDVHYASTVKTTIQSRSGKKADVIQFTSSPMKNMSFFGISGMFLKTITRFNSRKRKKKSIIRYCDNANNIRTLSSNNPCPPDHSWKETLTYLSTNKGTIIQTDNNMGMVSISQGIIRNKLLHIKNLETHTLTFEPIDIISSFNIKKGRE